MGFDFLTDRKFVELDGVAFRFPPTWTRLEPQSATGDPRPGIEARVHDPLWLMARQWQLGEFEGEDAGTPLTVRVVTRTAMVDRWAAPGGAAQALDDEQQDLLEPLVEREPVPADSAGTGLRQRAEAAAALLAALDDVGLDLRADFAAHCPLDLDPAHHPGGSRASLDTAWTRMARLLAGMADAELIAAAIEGAAPALPPWLPDAAEPVIAEWLRWYRAEVSQPPGGDDAWVGQRLEHRFAVGVGETVLQAPAHAGGDLDWHTFDVGAGPLPPPEGAPDAGEAREVHALLASPLRYPGMPADRLWEFEDAQVNLGLIEAEPWDLARLLVAEFALTYGNDWLVAPVDVPFGSLTTVESVTYTTTFGERFVVRPTDDVSPDGRWRMFTLTSPSGAGIDGLLIPPAAVAVQDGPPVEEVLYLRDEMANMVWAVERSIQGPSGYALDRSREPFDRGPVGPGPVTTAALDYRLASAVPARWIPYLAQSSGYRAVNLVRGAMPDAEGNAVLPIGRLLNSPDTAVLADAEIPREGLTVRRLPSMTRRSDGSYRRWITRRVSVGRGEGSSGLAFDSATARGKRAR